MRIPSKVKETMIIDKINVDARQANAIEKDFAKLEKLGVQKFYPSKCQFPAEF